MSFSVHTISSLREVSELIKLHNHAWNNSTGIIDLLENATECFLLEADENQNVIGYLFVERDNEKSFWEINDIVIDPAYRKQGLGKMLLDYAMQKYDYIKLNADASNKNLINFYLQAGFKREAVLENYYSIDKDAVRMFWKKEQ